MKVTKSSLSIIVIWMIIWSGMLIDRFFLLQPLDTISEITAQLEFVAHIFILYVGFKIYKNADQENKSILIWFVITNIGLLLNDISWYLISYFHFNMIRIALVPFLLNLILFFIWIIAIIIFSGKILNQYVLESTHRVKTWMVLIIVNIAIIVLFLSAIQYSSEVLLLSTLSQISTFIAQVVVFDFVILCLIHSENRGMSIFLSGILVLISGDFFIVYSIISQTSTLYAYGELLWFLGLLLNLFGSLIICDTSDYQIKSWVRKDNTIKSKLVFWCFSMAVISFLLFFIISYSFSIISKQEFLGLPLFIMIYSAIVIVLFSYVGTYFEMPFKKIMANIKTMMLADKKSILYLDFSIEEFVFLQKFITDAFVYRDEQEQEKINLERVNAQNEFERMQAESALKEEMLKNQVFQVTAKEQEKFKEIVDQTVHDIRSPIGTLNMLMKQFNDMPENLRTSLRKATSRITDITTGLVNQYKDKEGAFGGGERVDLLIVTDLYDILSEKRYEYSDMSIEFESHFSQDGYFAFIKADSVAFKRMLSNIINNAVDALEGKAGVVKLSLDVVDNYVHIVVEDNGKGMPEDVRQKILNKEAVTSGKEHGSGIGFVQIRETLANNDGQLEISTTRGVGSKVTVTFPQIHAPNWIATKIELKPDDVVVILDDDGSIHDAWEKVCDSHAPQLIRRHFEHGSAAIEFINGLTASEKEKIFLLTDYELLKQDVNGLDVVEQTNIQRSILVTSHHANKDVLKRATLMNTKVLPKPLAHEVPVMIGGQLSVVGNEGVNTSIGRALRQVDLIIVDDDEDILHNIMQLTLKGKKVDGFSSAGEFLANMHKYALTTKIVVDYKLVREHVNGLDIIQILHKKGFSNCYLFSGMPFKPGEIPVGIRVIPKEKMAVIASICEHDYDDMAFAVLVGTATHHPAIDVDVLDQSSTHPKKVSRLPIGADEFNEMESIARQVLHDMRTPMANIDSVADFSSTISMPERVALKRAISKLRDATARAFGKYLPNSNLQDEQQQSLPLRCEILNILHEKQEKYKKLKIKFEQEWVPVADFAFVLMVPTQFRQMIADVIEIAVARLKGKSDPKIEFRLNTNGDFAVISFEDNGCGIPADILNKIEEDSVFSGQENHSYSKLVEIRQLLGRHLGKLVINSTENVRTKVMLRIPMTDQPNWSAVEVKLHIDDIIVILERDKVVHQQWRDKLTNILAAHPTLKVEYFASDKDLIKYVLKLPEALRNKTILLGDYDDVRRYVDNVLVSQELEMPPRIILMVEDYTSLPLLKLAANYGMRILPKELIEVIPVIVQKQLDPFSRKVDMVWVDDEKIYIDELINRHYHHLSVDTYYDPTIFLNEVEQYPLDTRIFLDYNYYHNDNYKYDVNGVTIAAKLHAKGYTNLFLLSAEPVINKPDYLKLVLKTDVQALQKLDQL